MGKGRGNLVGNQQVNNGLSKHGGIVMEEDSG